MALRSAAASEAAARRRHLCPSRAPRGQLRRHEPDDDETTSISPWGRPTPTAAGTAGALELRS